MSTSEVIVKMPLASIEPPIKPKQKSLCGERKLEVFCGLLFLIFCGSTLVWIFFDNIIELNEMSDFNLDDASQYFESNESVQKYQWISQSYSDTPSNLVEAGYDSDYSTLRVIRAKNDNEEFVIGKYASRGDAYIYNKGRELGVESFEFLRASSYSWKQYVSPSDRVYADNNQSKYVCRVTVVISSKTLKIPGFTDESENCKYSYGYQGYDSNDFEVLSVP